MAAQQTTELGSRVLEHSPVGSIDGMYAANLGEILDVDVEGRTITWHRPRPALLWSVKKKALFMFEDVKSGPTGPIPDDTPGNVVALYEKWSGWDADHQRTLTSRARGSWRAFGEVTRIDYYSRKWDKPASYQHASGSGVRLYRFGAVNKGPWIWAIKGGRMTVTARGIVH